LGAIAAAFKGNSEDPEALVETMLLEMRHRGVKSTILQHTAANQDVATLGYASHYDNKAQVSDSSKGSLVLDGSIFKSNDGARFVNHRLDQSASKRIAVKSVLEEPAAFACVFYSNNRICAFRDLKGLKPLYFGEGPKIMALSSERKALWRVGVKDVERVVPGHLYSITQSGHTDAIVSHFERPKEKPMTIRQACSRLSFLLQRSARRITQRVDKAAVAFSGGLDSAVTALLAKRTNSKVAAVSVGLPGSPELSTVEHFARELDLPLTIETFPLDALEEYVRRVVWLIEEPNLMKVGVAIPLHWAAKVAADRGCKVMLCGQGSDELYGGYYKYARTLDSKGREALRAELYRSVVDSAQVNYERDDQATSPFGIELRTLFADLDVIRFSLSIPTEFKVRPGNDVTRKWVLRSTAKELGLPEDIVWRRKKAIQHGTGVENAIRRLAKQRGLTAEGYLLKVQEEVKGIESMP
jgi:asparagine synthase (glutamine-hydrolysing)